MCALPAGREKGRPMRPWTPKTDMVRRLYVAGREATSPAEALRMSQQELAEEFDRWLDGVRAATRDSGTRGE